jgi:hypothetical protein
MLSIRLAPKSRKISFFLLFRCRCSCKRGVSYCYVCTIIPRIIFVAVGRNLYPAASIAARPSLLSLSTSSSDSLGPVSKSAFATNALAISNAMINFMVVVGVYTKLQWKLAIYLRGNPLFGHLCTHGEFTIFNLGDGVSGSFTSDVTSVNSVRQTTYVTPSLRTSILRELRRQNSLQ